MKLSREFLWVVSSLTFFILSEALTEKQRRVKKMLRLQKVKSTWYDQGYSDIQLELSKKKNTNIAKNIIIFIGDGMGVSTVTAARILEGQNRGQPGEENVLNFEKFDHIALSKTYNVDRLTPDSAGTSTALLCGAKTNFLVMGLDGKAVFSDCAASKDAEELDSILDWAQAAGKRTGIISTARITHATPAASYAKTPNRDWEGDTKMSSEDKPCKDIALQLIEDNPDINVILGGGRQFFYPNTKRDPETGNVEDDQRADGRNLIKEWKKEKNARDKKSSYVWNRDQFLDVEDDTEYLLGLFNPSHMDFDLLRQESGPSGEPSIAEMVEKAISILKQGDDGFVLVVEGARIDHGHHYNLPSLALHDAIAFDKAVKVAKKNTKSSETLMIVTADHSQPFSIAGYPDRGANILDLVDFPLYQPTDGKPMTVLQYSNGPGFSEPRKDMSDVDTTGVYQFSSGIPLPITTHTGEDVAIYADGPMAHLVNVVKEQSYIAHVMAYSACIGPYSSGDKLSKCTRDRNDN